MEPFTAEETVILSNEWMRRYTEDPASFQAQWQTVGIFLAELSAGRRPGYGEHCVAYLDELRKEFIAAGHPNFLRNARARKA